MSEREVEFRVLMGKYMCTGIIRLRGGLSARLLDDSTNELPDLSSRARYDPSPEDVAPPRANVQSTDTATAARPESSGDLVVSVAS